MIINEENRDLFTVPQGYYLAHCISRDLALGAGIATQFVEHYNMREKLRLLRGIENVEVGEAVLIDNVFNLITKEKAFQKPTLESLEETLQHMKYQMEKLMIDKLAIPQLGCGLDRLDWDDVRETIETVFKDTDVEILICYI